MNTEIRRRVEMDRGIIPLMPQSGPQQIGTRSGAGQLIIDGHGGVPVNYEVRIFQETLEGGVPGLKSASGHFADLKQMDALKAMGRTQRLVLSDGTYCDVILTDLHGAFLVSGPIA